MEMYGIADGSEVLFFVFVFLEPGKSTQANRARKARMLRSQQRHQ